MLTSLAMCEKAGRKPSVLHTYYVQGPVLGASAILACLLQLSREACGFITIFRWQDRLRGQRVQVTMMAWGTAVCLRAFWGPTAAFSGSERVRINHMVSSRHTLPREKNSKCYCVFEGKAGLSRACLSAVTVCLPPAWCRGSI